MDRDPLEKLKQAVCDAIDGMAEQLLAISHEIHAHPELAFEESRACALLVEKLSEAGLDVKPGAFGLETAFSADFAGAQASPGSPDSADSPDSQEEGQSCDRVQGAGHGVVFRKRESGPARRRIAVLNARPTVH